MSSKVDHQKIEIAKLAQLINILRSKLGGKSLAQALKTDTAVVKEAMEELVAI